MMSGPYIQVDETRVKYHQILADCLPGLRALANRTPKEHFLFSGKIQIVHNVRSAFGKWMFRKGNNNAVYVTTSFELAFPSAT
jgi:hypothetical protein